MTDLTNRRSFVTGGGSGIGRAAALQLARAGSFVTVAGRTVASLDETVTLIRTAGGDGQAVICDVSDEESVINAVRVAAGHRGDLAIAINSAGVSGGDDVRAFADYETSQFDRIIATDLRGTFRSTNTRSRQCS